MAGQTKGRSKGRPRRAVSGRLPHLLKRIGVSGRRQHQKRKRDVPLHESPASRHHGVEKIQSRQDDDQLVRILNSRKSVKAIQNRVTLVQTKIHNETIG